MTTPRRFSVLIEREHGDLENDERLVAEFTKVLAAARANGSSVVVFTAQIAPVSEAVVVAGSGSKYSELVAMPLVFRAALDSAGIEPGPSVAAMLETLIQLGRAAIAAERRST